jgi:hypothetical protein
MTIEFWMKKNGWVTTPDAGSHKEVIFNVQLQDLQLMIHIVLLLKLFRQR